jgi:hypothetical protein
MGVSARPALGALLLAGLLASPASVCAQAEAPPSVHVQVEPSSLRLGVDRHGLVSIEAPDVPVDELELVASVGRISGLTRVAPGRFVARFEPPASRAPDVALLVARVRGGTAAGLGVIPLAGRYHLTLTIEPGAQVRIETGDAPPRHAITGARGVLDVVLHVPPGIEQARIVATDRAGNQTEHLELLGVPPLHRVLVLPAPPPSGTPRAMRWLVAAVTAVGRPMATPPTLDVHGALAEVTRLADGLFEVLVQPARHVERRRVTLRVREPNTASVPETVDSIVQGVVPVRLELPSALRTPAGQLLELLLAVRDAEGLPVEGLERALSASLAEHTVAGGELRGDRYLLPVPAPERAGTYELTARVALPDGSVLQARAPLVVVPDAPARVMVEAPPLHLGEQASITLRARDRYGNPAPLVAPAVAATGATLGVLDAVGEAVRVRLVPASPRVLLDVRGDHALHETVDLRATAKPWQPLALGVVAGVRSNLGATVFWGARARLEGHWLLGAHFVLLGLLDAGVEFGTATDASRNSGSVLGVPAMLRAGVLWRPGRLGLGAVAGGGARYVLAQSRGVTAETMSEGAVVGGLSLGLLARLETPAGLLFGEVGMESGYLDTLAVRGTLGGIYGALGWAFGL